MNPLLVLMINLQSLFAGSISKISTYALGIYPFAETQELCACQVQSIMIAILLMLLLIFVRIRFAIKIDKALDNGKYWLWVLLATIALLTLVTFSVKKHHDIRTACVQNSAQTDSINNVDKYSPTYDVVGYYLGTHQRVAEVEKEPVSSVLLAMLKVFLFNGVFVAAIVGLFSQRRMRIRKGEIRYSTMALCGRKYAVVIGANEVAASVIRNLLRQNKDEFNKSCEKTNDFVILQTSSNVEEIRKILDSHLTEQELRRVIIYSALRDSLNEVRNLHLQFASEIYVLGENTSWDKGETYHDAMNMRCLNLIVDVLKEKRCSKNVEPKKCSVLFEYHTTSSIFQFSDIEKEAKQVVNFVPFNRHEIWAKNVFVHNKSVDLIDCDETKQNDLDEINYKPLDGYDGISPNDNAHVHLVIVGMSKMGIALAVQALHQAHYPNIVNYPEQRTRITFIDTNADKEMAFFKGRYATLFELIRHRYIDTVGNDTYEKKWIDPIKEDTKWQHLSDAEDINKKNFLDVEVEFIKGSVESDNIRSILCEISKDQTAKLTIAICLTQTHQAIAASLYMPIEVYENKQLQQILVYQREVSDIVTNLEKNKHHVRYMNLRPFGMLYGEYINERAYFYKSMLVNWAYSVHKEKQRWPQNFDEDSDIPIQIKQQWDNLKVCNQYSNMFFVDTIYQKIRCILKEYKTTLNMGYHGKMYETSDIQTIIKSAIDKYQSELAICEHNRWNVQQLLLGFTPANQEQDNELRKFVVDGIIPKEKDAEFETIKNDLKSDVRRIHPNICEYNHLALIDPEAQLYDRELNKAIPRILMLIDGRGMCLYKEEQNENK